MPPVKNTTIALVIPTRNAAEYLKECLPAIEKQHLKPDEFLVIDSESSDNTVELCRAAGAKVVVIPAKQFNHGGTRRQASEMLTSDVLIFMTQDAILSTPDSLQNLANAVAAFPEVGCAYGRQLPHYEAGLLGAHGRLFNYPAKSRTKSMQDAPTLGIKTCFSSDSFAAYRKKALEEIDGFPRDVIGSEDSYVAGQMLLKGWAVRYEASAMVYHSHDYTIMAEFKRYFDIGVFYGRERWIREHFGSAGNEGLRFIKSELKAIMDQRAFHLLFGYPLRILMKASGYRLGKLERLLPTPLKRRISMFPGYWK